MCLLNLKNASDFCVKEFNLFSSIHRIGIGIGWYPVFRYHRFIATSLKISSVNNMVYTLGQYNTISSHSCDTFNHGNDHNNVVEHTLHCNRGKNYCETEEMVQVTKKVV